MLKCIVHGRLATVTIRAMMAWAVAIMRGVEHQK
jgi:hypothetical protein